MPPESRFERRGRSHGRDEGNTPEHIPVPTDDGVVETIPFVKRHPAIPISNIPVAKQVPNDENKRAKLLLCRLQAVVGRLFRQNQANLPPIPADQAGPYFCFLEKAQEGGFQWDL